MTTAKPGLKLLAALGLPSFGLTFSVTILSAYVPSLLRGDTSPIIIGLIIGAEGFFGLFMPVIVGNLADHAKQVGERFRYLFPAIAAMTAALVLMSLFRETLPIGLLVALFYVGYYAYLAPYWALYPDLVPKDYSGRARSAESVWRVIGALTALISGGFLLNVWRPFPFILAAGLLGIVSLQLMWFLGKHRQIEVKSKRRTFRKAIAFQWNILAQNAPIRNLAIANAFWNAALRSILTFVVLFFVNGLGRSHSFVSGFIFPIAAIGMLIMAPLSGKLADRYGHLIVIAIACIIYGIGDLLPGITQSPLLFAVIPLVSGAAATVMTLPYAVLMRLLSDETHGAASGLFGFSRGVGSFAGPLLAGIAVELGRGVFVSTHGYAAFWLMTGLYVLLSLPFLYRIHLEQPASMKGYAS